MGHAVIGFGTVPFGTHPFGQGATGDEVFGTAQSDLGGLQAGAAGARTVSADGVADLGGLTATVGVDNQPNRAQGDLGGLTAVVVGRRIKTGTGSVHIGFVAVAGAFAHQFVRTPRAGIPTTGRLTVGTPTTGPLSVGMPIRNNTLSPV